MKEFVQKLQMDNKKLLIFQRGLCFFEKEKTGTNRKWTVICSHQRFWNLIRKRDICGIFVERTLPGLCEEELPENMKRGVRCVTCQWNWKRKMPDVDDMKESGGCSWLFASRSFEPVIFHISLWNHTHPTHIIMVFLAYFPGLHFSTGFGLLQCIPVFSFS